MTTMQIILLSVGIFIAVYAGNVLSAKRIRLIKYERIMSLLKRTDKLGEGLKKSFESLEERSKEEAISDPDAFDKIVITAIEFAKLSAKRADENIEKGIYYSFDNKEE